MLSHPSAGRAQCTTHATLRTVCMLQVRADALAAPEPLYVDAIFNFVLAGPSRSLLLPMDDAGTGILVASTLGTPVPG